jgi:adenylate kinase
VQAELYLDVPLDVLVERLAGRWVCRVCQASYHEQFHRRARDGRTWTSCRGELYQRTDDGRDVVENRVSVYCRGTQPVLEHYAAHGIMGPSLALVRSRRSEPTCGGLWTR